MANFPGLVLTTAGRNLQAKAQIGAALQFTRVALGDGSSNAPDAMSALANERLSLSIQEFEVVGDGTSRMRVIMTNEALTSGFFVRELGVFAEDPDTGEEQLYSYTNAGDQPDFLPAGGGATLVENVFDLYTVVGNAQNVTAKINDYITIATKQDIDVIRPLLMPEGGTTHQLPRKRSNEEGDVEWFDPAEGVNIAVDSLEERRIAVAEQQTFRLTLITTRGLAVYVNGQRLPRNGWTPLGETQVRISKALQAGDEVLFVRNEEMGEIVIPRVSLSGPSLVYPGSSNTFQITDYDAFASYDIATTRGEVSRSGDTITLTLEAEEQDGALDLNVTRDGAGITYEIAVGEQTIATPQWAYPGMNDTGVPLLPTLQATPFRTYPRNADQHANSDWQIATDAEFNQVVWESLNDSENLASITISDALPINTSLHARHRQTGQQLGTTAWQSVAFTTVDQYIIRPTITSPADGETDVPEQPIIETSVFETYPAGVDTHRATSWWVYDADDNVLWESLEDTQNLNSIAIPSGVLSEGGAVHRVTARHHGNELPDSAHTFLISFITESQFVPDQAGVPFGGGYFAGLMHDENGIEYALIVSPKSEGSNNGAKVSFAQASGYTSGLNIGGHSDWKRPDPDECIILYRNFKPTTANNRTGSGSTNRVSPPLDSYSSDDPARTNLIDWIDGGSESFYPDTHWTSLSLGTINGTPTAKSFNFEGGSSPSYSFRSFNFYVRAVRRHYL